MKLIETLLNNKEFELLKKLLKYNDVVGNFNTKEMNKRFCIEGYRFAKNHGRLMFQKNYYFNNCNKKRKANEEMVKIINSMTLSENSNV